MPKRKTKLKLYMALNEHFTQVFLDNPTWEVIVIDDVLHLQYELHMRFNYLYPCDAISKKIESYGEEILPAGDIVIHRKDFFLSKQETEVPNA